MPKGAVMAPLREGAGCQNGAPLFLRCFSTCLGSSGIYISSLLSEATEAMLLSFIFGTPEMARVKRVICVSGGCAGGAKTPPL